MVDHLHIQHCLRSVQDQASLVPYARRNPDERTTHQLIFQMHPWIHLQQIDRPVPDSLEDLLDREQVGEQVSFGQPLGLASDLLIQALQE